YFVRGQSAIGARAFDRSVTAAISPIIWDELRQMSALPCLGASLGEAPRWAYASLDAAGPLPYGIFTRQAEAPTLPEAGDRVVLPAWEGVRYFYTTDGSDPYVSCPDGAESLDVTLGRGQVLTVFAARQGYRDSEVLIYSAEEGTR
ncbi:hypothetical protein LJC34_07750, partial [Oscillospiraceae bacterium OttesenSCG-928-G22]|nr:hypothetical protein [Oscillospiraceae bacterium OttesenSCG-928-G22]